MLFSGNVALTTQDFSLRDSPLGRGDGHDVTIPLANAERLPLRMTTREKIDWRGNAVVPGGH
jgi:hypothetical protein